MFGVLFKIFIDHVERALKDGVEDLGHFTGDVVFQIVYDGRHRQQDFRLPRCRHCTSVVVQEDGVEQWRDKAFQNLSQQTSTGKKEKQEML